MILSRYSDVSRQLAKNTCECGRRKRGTAEACERCRFLDGRTNAGRRASIADVISVLRGTDGLSLKEICEELGISANKGNGQRGVHRLAMSMLRSGRVRRYWREREQEIVVGGIAGRRASGPNGCWVYVLDGAVP